MKPLLWIVLLWSSALARADGATDASDVVARARTHVQAFDADRDREDNENYRRRSVSFADSLESLDEWILASQCLERAGIIHYLRGEWDAALAVWERGLAVARTSEDPKRIAALLNARAAGLDASGEHARAAVAFAALVEARRAIGDVRGEGIAWHNLAVAQRTSWRLPEAMASIRRAMALHAEASNRHGRANGFHVLAQLLQRYGRLDAARAAVDSAIAIAEDIDYTAVLGPAVMLRASMAIEAGDIQAAQADAARARALMERAGVDQQVGAAEALLAAIAISRKQGAEALDHVERAAAVEGRRVILTDDIALEVLRARALVLLGRSEAARAVLTQAAEELERLEVTLTEDVRRGEMAAAVNPYGVLAQLHVEAERAASAWKAVERGLARNLRRSILGREATVSLSEFQSLLGERDAVALVYGVATGDGLPVVFVSPDSVRARWIDDWPTLWRDLRQATETTTHAVTAGPVTAARERLAEVLLAALPTSPPTRLVVVPGSLAGLSFESLPCGSESLGDRVAISYAPSATVLHALEQREAASHGFLGWGAPRFADPKSDDVRVASLAAIDLPGAREELRAIAPRARDTYVGTLATRETFLDRAFSARVLHIATHAVVDGGTPTASGILLTDSQGRPALVGVGEIARHRVDADLVTVSACRAAGGYVVLGEGSFGLTRAFLEGGARTVVSSWSDVEDDVARRFMEAFYARLRVGDARDVAALAARRQLRDEGVPLDQRHAFVVVGATGGTLDVALTRAPVRSRASWVLLIVSSGALVWALFRHSRSKRIG